MRTVLLAAGTLSTAAGAGLLLVPSAGEGVGPLVLVGVVVGTLALTGSAGVSRLSTPRERPEPPRSGAETGATVPGDEFDRRLASLSTHSSSDAEERAAVRERLRTLAVDRVVAESGCSRATARERVERGDWTDDQVAAALFTDDRPSLVAQLRALAGGTTPFRRRAERAVAVLTEGGDE
jgi:hypothetical protein